MVPLSNLPTFSPLIVLTGNCGRYCWIGLSRSRSPFSHNLATIPMVIALLILAILKTESAVQGVLFSRSENPSPSKNNYGDLKKISQCVCILSIHHSYLYKNKMLHATLCWEYPLLEHFSWISCMVNRKWIHYKWGTRKEKTWYKS